MPHRCHDRGLSTDPDHYFNRSQRPLQSLIFLLPFLIIYEVGVLVIAIHLHIAHPQHILARSFLEDFLGLFGAAGRYMPGLAVVMVLLSWHIARRDKWEFDWRLNMAMGAESVALAVPLLDTGLSIVRRFLRKEKIWDADRGHIHHRLLDRGLTPRKAVLVLYAAAALGAIFSIMQGSIHNGYSGLVIILFCVAAWIGVQHLGYVEFGMAGRMFIDGAFRRHLNGQLQLQKFEEELQIGRASCRERV